LISKNEVAVCVYDDDSTVSTKIELQQLADKEALMNMTFHLTQINNIQFGGCGYFIRSEIVKGLK